MPRNPFRKEDFRRETTGSQVERMLAQRQQQAENELGKPANKNIITHAKDFIKNNPLAVELGLVGGFFMGAALTLGQKFLVDMPSIDLGTFIGSIITTAVGVGFLGWLVEATRRRMDQDDQNNLRRNRNNNNDSES